MEFKQFGKKAYDFICTSPADDARINILHGAVRSSKTVAMIPKLLALVLKGPEGLGVITGVSKDTIADNVLRDLFDLIGAINYRYNRQSGDLTLFGRPVKVIGARDEGSEKYIRGKTLAWAYADEISLMPETFFKQLLNRLSIPGARLYGTTNPAGPYHFLYTEFITDQEKLASGMVKAIHFNLDDNPNLSEEYKGFIRAAHKGVFYQRFVEGLWVLAEGTIYDMWDTGRHVVKAKEKFENYICAVDYGTANPCTFGLYGYNDGLPATLIREYYHDGTVKRQKTDGQYADDLAIFLGNEIPSVVYVDPSALSFITELKQRAQYNVKAANNDVLEGIRFVSSLLTKGLYSVDASCGETVKGYSSYVWDANAQKRGEDKPLKVNDHTCDRDRYALYSHFFKKYRETGQKFWK